MLKKFTNSFALYMLVLLAGAMLASTTAYAQALKPMRSGDLQMAIKKLTVMGSVLYIAAHPDDENTRLISYLARHRNYETAYLSLTRGDGGQNLIGSEQGALLGIIRTQELLAARSIDGGVQYFTTANDFGFSKNPEETLQMWDKEKVLADVVWIIRKVRPDVIITRFPTDGSGGHGHHTASALLAEEAFKASGDGSRFPEQLAFVEPWQPKRLLWNRWIRPEDVDKVDPAKLLQVDVGTYNPLLGESYYDIAMDSRSQHKSQGFGAAKERGAKIEYLEHVMGEKATNDIFDGINTSWTRVGDNGDRWGKALNDAYKLFRPENPEKTAEALLNIYKTMYWVKPRNPEEKYWLNLKREQIKNLIRECAGIWLETVADVYACTPGDSLTLTTTVIKRNPFQARFTVLDIAIADGYTATAARRINVNHPLQTNEAHISREKIKLSTKLKITQPYWLEKPEKRGMYQVDNQLFVGQPETPPEHMITYGIEMGGLTFFYSVPVMYKWTHRVDGERYRPLEIVPPVTANIKEPVLVFANGTSKVVQVSLKAWKKNASGKLSLDVPQGWQCTPASIEFKLSEREEEKTVQFTLSPPAGASVANLVARINGKAARAFVQIDYPHIPIQTMYPETQVRIVKLDVNIKGRNIAYYEGAGDEIPASLRQIGYQVSEMNEQNFDKHDLSNFDAIITGIRAYNTKNRLKYQQEKLLEYVKNGGTLIVQYNVNFGLVTDKIGPYPFRISRERVTVEEAPVNLLKPAHPLLNTPNKITQADFEGWVQERGLYFADQWGSEYETLLSTADPGEKKPLEGGLLLASYGKGYFIYTGYAWFRQLPAGVPGAYRLFTNMLSYGK